MQVLDIFKYNCCSILTFNLCRWYLDNWFIWLYISCQIQQTVQGEELPYVFGVPLDGRGLHYDTNYSQQEKLLSEVVMTLWTNFAKTGYLFFFLVRVIILRKENRIRTYPCIWWKLLTTSVKKLNFCKLSFFIFCVNIKLQPKVMLI